MPHFLIDGNPSFGVQLAKRDMQRPPVVIKLSETVQGKMNAFSETDSGAPDEQQCIGVQVVDSPEFLLQQLIILWGERSGKVHGKPREILGENQTAQTWGV